jgi:hypothetical protein
MEWAASRNARQGCDQAIENIPADQPRGRFPISMPGNQGRPPPLRLT